MTKFERPPAQTEWIPRSRFERERKARQRAEELLEQMSRRLYDGQKARERFITSVNHEFRTPINGILGPAQLMKAENYPGEIRTYAEAIETCANQIFQLFESSIAAAEIALQDETDTMEGRAVPSILVVDDNAINRMVLKAAIEAIGMTVLQAENGAEALDMLPEYRPDAVLMDVQMPVMDGSVALKAIRQSDAEWRGIPVVVITADAEPDGKDRYLAMGANAYMTKPVIVRRLQDLLNQFFPHHRRAAA